MASLVGEMFRGYVKDQAKKAVSPSAIKDRFQHRAKRGEIPVGPVSVRTYDRPSESWTRGTDTVVEVTIFGIPMDGTQTVIPTGGIVNRFVHGKPRRGAHAGPVYRFEAEQDVERAQALATLDALLVYSLLGSVLSESPLTPPSRGRRPEYARFV